MPNVRIVYSHPNARAAAGDPPMALSELAGVEIKRYPSANPAAAVILAALVPTSATEFTDIDPPPGSTGYELVWIDTEGRRSTPRVTGIVIPEPVVVPPPAAGNLLSISLT